MKKIIVPIDFSEYSEYALQTASFIAKKINAKILAVHMLEGSDSNLTKSSYTKNKEKFFYLKLAEKKFKSLLDKDYLKGVKVKPMIANQKDFKDLSDIGCKEHADLIIMGSQGVFGFKELFVGSNTEKVVRNAQIPVLVIKGAPVTSSFKAAVFACDFSDEDIAPYRKAKNLLNLLGCKIQLLYVETPSSKFMSNKERQDKVVRFLTKADNSLENLNEVTFFPEYSIEEGILDFANTHGKDLIVMATRGTHGIHHFIYGSISEDVANHANLPVMTFRI